MHSDDPNVKNFNDEVTCLAPLQGTEVIFCGNASGGCRFMVIPPSQMKFESISSFARAVFKASKFGDADWVENRTKRIENFLIQQQESVIKHQKDYYDSCHYVAMATLENIILPENYFFAKEVILSNNQTLSKYSYKDQKLLLEKLKRQYGYDKEFFIDDNQIFFIFKLGFDYSSKRYNRLSEEETRVKNDRVKDAFGKSYYSSAFRGKNVDVLESESNLYVVKKKKSLLVSFYSVSLSDEDVEKIAADHDKTMELYQKLVAVIKKNKDEISDIEL